MFVLTVHIDPVAHYIVVIRSWKNYDTSRSVVHYWGVVPSLTNPGDSTVHSFDYENGSFESERLSYSFIES